MHEQWFVRDICKWYMNMQGYIQKIHSTNSNKSNRGLSTLQQQVLFCYLKQHSVLSEHSTIQRYSIQTQDTGTSLVLAF